MSNYGPGDVIAGLAPPQDNGPSAAQVRGDRRRRVREEQTGGLLQGDDQRRARLSLVGGTDVPQSSPAGPSPDALRTDGVTPTGDQAEQPAGEPGATNDATIGQPSLLAGQIRADWSRNKRARDRMEYRLLACMYARRMEYQLDELNNHWTDGCGSGLYLGELATKMRICDAMMKDLILPEGDKPWGVDPPPVPDLPPAWAKVAKDRAEQRAQAQLVQIRQQQGALMDFNAYKAKRDELLFEAQTEARKEMQAQAKQRAARMEQNLETLSAEGGYTDAMREFIHHFGTFPTAVLAGPFPKKERVGRWTDDNRFEVADKIVAHCYALHPLDAYPAPEAKSAQQGCFIERLRWTRGDLYACIGVEGFFDDAIRRVLEYHEAGGLRGWLWTDMERRQLEGMTWDTWQPDYLIDALRYWNAVEGRALKQLGVDIGDSDPLAYYEVCSVLVGNEVVYATINEDPLGRRPYQHASYDPVPGAFWGNGIYDLGRDCQSMVNGAVRAIDANMGLASGPIIGVDVSQLAEDEDPKAAAPLEIVQLDRSRSSNPTAEPLTFFQADSRATEHLMVMDRFCQKLDDLTGIPRIQMPAPGTQGDGTATQRRIELAMQSKSIRGAAFSIDQGVTKPYFEKLFYWEMVYGTDQAAKGAAIIVPRGTMAQIVKEHLQEAQGALLDKLSQNPVLARIAGDEGIAEVARGVVDSVGLDVDKVIPDDQTLKQRAASQPPPQPSPDAVLKAQTDRYKTDKNAAVKLLTEAEIHPREAGQLSQAAQAVAQPGMPGAQPGAAPQGAPNGGQ